MRILAAVYSDPEYYPPTLNAIGLLADHCEKITVLSRNVKKKEWDYPKNVQLIRSGSLKNIRAVEKASALWKIISFLKFTFNCYRQLLLKPDWVICYDPIPLFSYRIASFFLSRKPKLWYHNHDILSINFTKKFSVGWFASKSEKKMFKAMAIFSLPAQERKQYFNIDEFKGKYFYIPNYPSLLYYKRNLKKSNDPLKNIDIIYQGSISYLHGLEEIIKIIPQLNREFGKKFRLILKGFISEAYTIHMKQLARETGVENSLKIIGVGPYLDLISISSKCHIGIAVHTANDIMNKTLGTSSNKIYEYIAGGLPVILYDNEHFKKHLQHKKWAFFTDLSERSLLNIISSILKDYEAISIAARGDFEKSLNFENNFNPIIHYIKS